MLKQGRHEQDIQNGLLFDTKRTFFYTALSFFKYCFSSLKDSGLFTPSLRNGAGPPIQKFEKPDIFRSYKIISGNIRPGCHPKERRCPGPGNK